MKKINTHTLYLTIDIELGMWFKSLRPLWKNISWQHRWIWQYVTSSMCGMVIIIIRQYVTSSVCGTVIIILPDRSINDCESDRATAAAAETRNGKNMKWTD